MNNAEQCIFSTWVEHSAHFDSSEEFARVDILFKTINAKIEMRMI